MPYVIPTLRIRDRGTLQHWVDVFGVELQSSIQGRATPSLGSVERLGAGGGFSGGGGGGGGAW